MLDLTCEPCSRGYHLAFERPLSCAGLTVISLDVKENRHIFIGTFSPEHRGAEQSVIGDVMYLSVYLVWQSPQVCWVLISTGTSESEISFITSAYGLSRTHSTHCSYTDTHRQEKGLAEMELWSKFKSVISSLNPSVHQGTANAAGFVSVTLVLQGSAASLRLHSTYWHA